MTHPAQPRSTFFRLIYVGLVLLFLWQLPGFYVPGKGFSAFLTLGDRMQERYLPQLLATDPYIHGDSWGYDAQQYIQIALEPGLNDPHLTTAVDNISYRARRILLCWTAYVFGGGSPEGIVWVFVLQGLVFWLALGWLLLRWFPPNSLDNLVRWGGILFAYGMFWSVRQSLFDGPSIFIIALGMAFLEAGRTRWATVTLGLGGLVKETNLLSAVALLPFEKDLSPRQRFLGLVRTGLVALPLFAWIAFVSLRFGHAQAQGIDNFAAPFAGLWQKYSLLIEEVRNEGWDANRVASVYFLITLIVQAGFFLLRPQWRNPWWRVGMAYTVLMVFLGRAVWEGNPGAGVRVLLPMLLAFNFLVPRTRRWFVVLVLGNLTVLSSSIVFQNLPPREVYEFTSLTRGPVPALSFELGAGWNKPERSRFEYWIWGKDASSEFTVVNHSNTPFTATVTFSVNGFDQRRIQLAQDGRTLWSQGISPERTDVVLREVILPPGTSRFAFTSDKPEGLARSDDVREVTFNLRNLRFEVP